ncbi:MAG: ABC transporter ATP-binding protein [Spirochaetales bacterium]|nr:ABC transporter ATP-binding protein [Spirochaetales bacterium]
MDYQIEMLNITKSFPGILANDNISLQLKHGEIHALLGENGAGKSTLMSILFGLYLPEHGTIKKNGQVVQIHNPNDANSQGIGMVHQHFKLVHNFTVLENIILGVETTKNGVLRMDDARKKVVALSQKYNLLVDPDAVISDITVGMQQRVEILKMLYRENDILIFDEPTAMLLPQEIIELIEIMKGLVKEGKSVLFITHKLEEIKLVADRCTVLRKGKYIDTVDVASTSKEKMSELMVGRKVEFIVAKNDAKPADVVLEVKGLTVKSKFSEKNKVHDVSFTVRRGEILCIAGIDGNGQSELIYALTGLINPAEGEIFLDGKEISHATIRARSEAGMSHIPEDRHKHGLILDYNLDKNLVLQKYFTREFQKNGFLKFNKIAKYANKLIQSFDIRSGQGAKTVTRSMSGGNQQKAIVAREISKDPELLIAVQPTRGLDVGAIEYIHKQLINQRDKGKGVLLLSLELDEVMNISDRIVVIHDGELVSNLDPKKITIQELGLYMSGAKKEGSDE